MMIALMLALSLFADPQRRPPGPPPPPPPDIAAIAEHAARLAVLEYRKQELEAELIEARSQFGYGENHPQMIVLRQKLAQAEKALATEGSAWRENEIDQLAGTRSALEQQLNTVRKQKGYGQNHPVVLSLSAQIAAITTTLSDRSKGLLASGHEQALLAETTKTDASLDAFLRLAKLYAAAGRTADAERALTDAIALLRARGK